MSKLSEETRAVNDLDVGPADVAQMLGDSSLLEPLREAQRAERSANDFSARKKEAHRPRRSRRVLPLVYRAARTVEETGGRIGDRGGREMSVLARPQWCRSGESSACSTPEEFRTTRAEVPAAALRSYTRASSSDKELPNTSEATLANLK